MPTPKKKIKAFAIISATAKGEILWQSQGNGSYATFRFLKDAEMVEVYSKKVLIVPCEITYSLKGK